MLVLTALSTPKICWAIKVLGLWIAANDGAKFWLSVMNNLRNRGVEDTFDIWQTGHPVPLKTAMQ